MIRILLVDDQALLCEVLKTWLEVEEDFQVAGVAHDGEEAIQEVARLQPDIILMDIDMPKMNGLEATQLISERFPNIKVIFLSAHDENMYAGKFLQAGAKGYLLKNTTAEELAEKIRSVYYNTEQILPVDEEIVSAIQRQLEDLMQTYQDKFQQQIEQAQASLNNLSPIEINSDYEQHLSDLSGYKQLVEQRLSELSDYEQLLEQRLSNFSGYEQLLEQRLSELSGYEQRLEQRLGDFSNRGLLDDEQRLGDFSDYEQRLSNLENMTQTGWESLRSEILSVQNQFSEANRSLGYQMNQQVVNLKKELDSQLTSALEEWSRQRAALQEWAVQLDEMRPTNTNISTNTDTNDFEFKYRNELMTVVNPIRGSLQELEKQLRIMRNGLIASILVATMALSFSGWVFLFNLGGNNSNSARQSSEQLESSQK